MLSPALLLVALFAPVHCQISIQIVNGNRISCTFRNSSDVPDPCFFREATGTGEPIEAAMGPGISLLPDSGRLIIRDPSPADEDIYWCCIPSNGCRGPFQSCSAPLPVYGERICSCIQGFADWLSIANADEL